MERNSYSLRATLSIEVNPGKSVEDNGNRFIGHAVSVESFKQVRKSIVEVMRINTISSASHKIYMRTDLPAQTVPLMRVLMMMANLERDERY